MQSHVSVCAGALGLALLCTSPVAARRAEHRQVRASSELKRLLSACEKQAEATEGCVERLKAHAKRHPADAFAAGKWVRAHAMHWEALDLFVLGVGEKTTDAECADSDLRAAVLSGLSLPPHYPAVGSAQALLQGRCRKQLEPEVTAQLKRAGLAFRNNACPMVPEKVRASRCKPRPEDDSVVAESPRLPTKAELVAKVPKLRETPPARPEPTRGPLVQRLEETFPSIPGESTGSTQPALSELRTLDWRLVDVDADSAELLRGLHGEELRMVHSKGERHPYVLLKLQGVEGPWNQRVLVALERATGAGKDYIALDGEHPVTVLSERQRQFLAFPKDAAPLWFSPVAPGDPTASLRSRREIAREIAAAPPAER